jgi:hypothetical protein
VTRTTLPAWSGIWSTVHMIEKDVGSESEERKGTRWFSYMAGHAADPSATRGGGSPSGKDVPSAVGPYVCTRDRAHSEKLRDEV